MGAAARDCRASPHSSAASAGLGRPRGPRRTDPPQGLAAHSWPSYARMTMSEAMRERISQVHTHAALTPGSLTLGTALTDRRARVPAGRMKVRTGPAVPGQRRPGGRRSTRAHHARSGGDSDRDGLDGAPAAASDRLGGPSRQLVGPGGRRGKGQGVGLGLVRSQQQENCSWPILRSGRCRSGAAGMQRR